MVTATENEIRKEEGTLLFKVGPNDNDLSEWASPQTKDQLKLWMELLFGIKIADTNVCDTHVAPLDALWASYSRQSPVIVWKASRGLGGKTTLLGSMCLIELLDGANITALGGSGQQSQRIHEVESDAWNNSITLEDGRVVQSPLKRFLPSEPTSWRTETIHKNWLRALTASSKAVRGPHPQRLRIDVVDEMTQLVFDAALGQAMTDPKKPHIRAQTTISSTQQYADGTMKYVLDQAAEKNWPVFEWCYRESHEDNGGWLTEEMLEESRSTVPQNMWKIEYDLQEPSVEGRVFEAASLLKMFIPKIGELKDEVGRTYEFERPRTDASYITGVDWARDQDYTVIVTLRTDVFPHRIVAFERINQIPYPMMVKKFENRLRRYSGPGIHDASGVGSAISDYINPPPGTRIIDISVTRKTDIYPDYIMAVEDGKINCPVVDSIHRDHRYVRLLDLYGTGNQGGHPPDSISALALAWTGVTGKAEQLSNGGKAPGRIRRSRSIGR